MVSVSEEKIIDFIAKSQQGELIQKEGKQTQKLKIGDKTYRYNKNKPASKVLNTRLTKGSGEKRWLQKTWSFYERG